MALSKKVERNHPVIGLGYKLTNTFPYASNSEENEFHVEVNKTIYTDNGFRNPMRGKNCDHFVSEFYPLLHHPYYIEEKGIYHGVPWTYSYVHKGGWGSRSLGYWSNPVSLAGKPTVYYTNESGYKCNPKDFLWRYKINKYGLDLRKLISSDYVMGHSKVDLPTFVGELRDIRMLFKQINISKIFREKGALDATASANLTYQLGLAPLANDLINMFNIIRNASDELQNWNRHASAGDRFRHHISLGENVKELNPIIKRATLTTQKGNKYVFETKIEGKVRVSGRASVYFSPKKLDENLTSWENLKRLFSLDDLPSTGWNLIPFSFMVDWFLNVGNLIEYMDSFNDEIVIHEHQTILSESYQYEYSVSTVIIDPQGTRQEVFNGVGLKKQYHRYCTKLVRNGEFDYQAYLPPNPFAFNGKLTSGKLSIIGSLLVTFRN